MVTAGAIRCISIETCPYVGNKKNKILLIHTVMQGVCAFAMFDFLSLSGVFTLITTY